MRYEVYDVDDLTEYKECYARYPKKITRFFIWILVSIICLVLIMIHAFKIEVTIKTNGMIRENNDKWYVDFNINNMDIYQVYENMEIKCYVYALKDQFVYGNIDEVYTDVMIDDQYAYMGTAELDIEALEISGINLINGLLTDVSIITEKIKVWDYLMQYIF